MTDASAGAAEADAEGADAGSDGRSYGGVLGAFPYAFRASESSLFRSYVAVGGLFTALVVGIFVLAVVVVIADTAGATGGTFTFSRAFFVVLMALVVAPLLAPVLSVARRHRRTGSTVGYDRALAVAGYVFLLSLYVGLVISTPEALQEESPGPVGSALYALPRTAGAGPPLLAAALVYVLHRRL